MLKYSVCHVSCNSAGKKHGTNNIIYYSHLFLFRMSVIGIHENDNITVDPKILKKNTNLVKCSLNQEP